ncbi:hypothetical protein EFW17_23590 [Halostreptopolyspora alba]|uniref:Bacterial CdiA-CT RNAse A domain-containing protein n=2 Tax=Halostreptopolyspora alba TaxID=2487137 RepID=A0A3N0DQS8_9ACTN|nr:hypothetical protein EFW17_23590 [Nocardiopsaceae bacterium YIM 96095]
MGGHTLDRHVGKDVEWLRRRAERDDLPQASSFTDQRTAEIAISNSLARNQNRIDNWINDADDAGQLVISKDPAGGNVGPIVRRDGSVKDGRKVTIVLRKDPNSDTGYRVHTAYPDK